MITEQFFQILKETTDGTDYHPFNGYYYRAGQFGLSYYKSVRGRMVEKGHSPNFRQKSLSEVNSDLKRNGFF